MTATDGVAVEDIRATWVYDTTDPLAVTMVLTQDAADVAVEWRFARDLLDVGVCSLNEPMGVGDVQIWRCCDEGVRIALTSHLGHIELLADLEDIEEFLFETYESVPLGSESEFFPAGELDELLKELTGDE